MSKTASKNGEARKPRWQFRGITRDAEELGVCRQWLWLCLTKRRSSRRLMARYDVLKKSQRLGRVHSSI